MRWLLLNSLACFLVTGIAAAQSTRAAAKLPGPGEFHKRLARSNGSWKGEASFWYDQDKPPAKSTSLLTSTMVMDGLFQVSEVRGNVAGMGKPFEGVRITGYDSTRKVVTRAMIGSDAPGVAMEGPWDEVTKSMTMPFKQADHTGKIQDLKEVYRFIDENTEVLEIYRLDPASSKEFKILEVKWIRQL